MRASTSTSLDFSYFSDYYDSLSINSVNGDDVLSLSSSLSMMISTMNDVLIMIPEPILYSCIAGASTCIGSAIVFLFDTNKDNNTQQLKVEECMSFALSLAASVMITVSVVSLGSECLRDVVEITPASSIAILDSTLLLQRVLSFGFGCTIYWILSKILLQIPEPESIFLGTTNYQHITATSSSRGSGSGGSGIAVVATSSTAMTVEENTETESSTSQTIQSSTSWRVTILLFVSLLLHNFPEGLAVAVSTMESTKLGIAVTIGIMIHNIPEGIAIAIPCMSASNGNKWLAFKLASISGLAEPVGAIVAIYILQQYDLIPSLDNVLSGVAGIMCMVSMLELYPEAYRHVIESNEDNQKDYNGMILGTLFGMSIMLATELYLPV